MPVYVQNKYGQPLMPCSPAKARHLLKDKKAKIIKRTPFTIQLLYGSSGYKQPIVLGVDAGSKTIGIAACTDKKVLYAAEVKPRNDVVELLSARREFRRARRNRTTRYRQPRFDNRTHSKHKGWLSPSIEVKIQEHITSIKRICIILPISKVIVETAEFDLQLIKAVEQGLPVPQGEDYQKGEMLGHYNVRQYVFFRDNYTCRCCGKYGKGIKLHAHHSESRKTGGNAPDNEITLCDDCHKKLHKGIITAPQLLKRKRKSTRDAAFMGIMRKTLMERLRNKLAIPVYETHGYVTKYTRVELLKLPKTHINDAISIAYGRWGLKAGMYHNFRLPECSYGIMPVRHHNRQLHKATILKGGIRKNNQAPKYVRGFRLWDKVLYNGIECFISGRRTSGYFALKTLDGKAIHNGANIKNLRLLERSTNYLTERRGLSFLPKEVGVPSPNFR
ncbi:MAG: HNH endonuclease [Oscillospiraceae bacterium]|nr:HNH endonuclease [Oscillospiraceae bacterium]